MAVDVSASWLDRLLARLTPFWLVGSQLSSAGVNVVTLLLALVLTLAFYAAFNRWASARIDVHYETLILSEFDTAGSSAEAADRAIRLRWADPRLQGWLQDVLAVPSASFPAHRQADALFLADLPTPESAARRQAILREFATGRRRPKPLFAQLGLPPEAFVLEASSATGLEVFEELASVDGGAWEKAVESRRQFSEEKKQFLVRYLDAVLRQTQPPVRDLQRLNGYIQWLTVFTAVLLLIVLARRALMLVKLRVVSARVVTEAIAGRPAEVEAFPRSSELHALAGELRAGRASGERSRQMLESIRDGVEGAYGTLSYLVSVLPSLGFLGTVMGLGDALLRADGLFASEDKQRTISLITQDLGFAFDTTLVALAAGLVVGLPLALLRQKDRRLLRDWSQVACGMGS